MTGSRQIFTKEFRRQAVRLCRESGRTTREIAEGPDARIVGVSGNRKFKVNYFPVPYSERINSPMHDVPSLYDYQLGQRMQP